MVHASEPDRPVITGASDHSEGPWAVWRGEAGGSWQDGTTVYSVPEGKHVADMTPLDTDERTRANARLIAAAPQMLEACRLICEFHTSVYVTERPLAIDGRTIDHTRLNNACRLAEEAIESLGERVSYDEPSSPWPAPPKQDGSSPDNGSVERSDMPQNPTLPTPGEQP